jgi:lipopolysaccharide export system permease protein
MLLILVALYGLIEFIEKADDLIEDQAALKYYLLYPLCHLPVILSNTLPMAVLLATFATIGGFSRTSQLTAIYSGGISLTRTCRTLFLCGAILALLSLVANLWLVPWSSRESNYMLRYETRGSTPQAEEGHDLYFRDGNRIISVAQSFPARGLVLDLTVVEFNDQFIPVKRMDAEKARYVQDGRWRLENVTSWGFDPHTRDVTAYARQPELTFDLARQPGEMLQLWDRPEDLTINELFSLTTKLSNEGYDPKTYRMETQMRFSRAAIPMIMVLVGIPFAQQRERKTGLALGIVISLIIFAVYFFFYAVFSVFGSIAVLPPPLAAWAANILMTLIGAWFLVRADN